MNFFLFLFLFTPIHAATLPALEGGRAAIESMQGCFLVDYSYAETESLKPGYQIDGRVYDVNKNLSFKEWIYAENISPTRLHIQHVLFATDLAGNLIEESFLKHTGEDWQFNSPFLYDFTAPLHWNVKLIDADLWTRKITSLDDGLRYQCAAQWDLSKSFPEWICNNSFAPIPGRETRDMGRKDYNTMDRNTRLVMYGNSWLERQMNIKTIYQNLERIPLAREVGKNWYVRLPDSDCVHAQQYVSPRRAFWNVMRESWDSVLDGQSNFEEKVLAGQPSRYNRIMALEDQFLQKDERSPINRETARQAILSIINEYRR